MSLLSSFRCDFKTNDNCCVKVLNRNIFNCYPLLPTKLVHIFVRIQILVFTLPPVFLPILLTTPQLPTRLPIHQPIKLPTEVYFLFNHHFVVFSCYFPNNFSQFQRFWVGGYIYIRAEILKIQLISPINSRKSIGFSFLDYQLLHARLWEYNLGEQTYSNNCFGGLVPQDQLSKLR